MEAQVEEKGDVVVVRVDGRLDAASSPALDTQIKSLIDSGRFKLILNLAKVDYLSSAGMRLLLAVSKKLKGVAGKLVVCNVKDEVMEVINMAGFSRVLEIYPSEEECYRHL